MKFVYKWSAPVRQVSDFGGLKEDTLTKCGQKYTYKNYLVHEISTLSVHYCERNMVHDSSLAIHQLAIVVVTSSMDNSISL